MRKLPATLTTTLTTTLTALLIAVSALAAAEPVLDEKKQSITSDVNAELQLLNRKRGCVEVSKSEEEIDRCQEEYYQANKLRRMGQAGRQEQKSDPKLKPGVVKN